MAKTISKVVDAVFNFIALLTFGSWSCLFSFCALESVIELRTVGHPDPLILIALASLTGVIALMLLGMQLYPPDDTDHSTEKTPLLLRGIFTMSFALTLVCASSTTIAIILYPTVQV